MLEKSIEMEKEKQKQHSDHLEKRGELAMALRCDHLDLIEPKANKFRSRLAIQHMLDVLRHVGSPDVFKNIEYPTVNLQLPTLQFNHNLPPVPMVMETNSELSKQPAAVKLLQLSRSQLQSFSALSNHESKCSCSTSRRHQTLLRPWLSSNRR